jgi:Flp pilus assembly pilin Flp
MSRLQQRAFMHDERGQTFVEYAVVITLVAALVLAGWTSLDTAINSAIGQVISAL